MALYNRVARLLADYRSTHRSCRQISQFVRSNEKRMLPVSEMIEESNLSKFEPEVQSCQGAQLKLNSEVEKLLNDLKNDLEKCKIELKGELKTCHGLAKQVKEIRKKLRRDVRELKLKMEGYKTEMFEFSVVTAFCVTVVGIVSAFGVAVMQSLGK